MIAKRVTKVPAIATRRDDQPAESLTGGNLIVVKTINMPTKTRVGSPAAATNIAPLRSFDAATFWENK